MSKKSKFFYQYRFIEVGILFNGYEFYQEFCIPINLCMRRYNELGICVKVSIEDWLMCDFAHILCQRLGFLSSSPIVVFDVKSILPSTRPLASVVSANSLVDTWVNPFINLIASYFINNFKNGK